MTSRAIPTIDFAEFREGGPDSRRAVGRAIGRACESIGFFTVINHGVPRPVIAAAYESALTFFDLPDEEKRRSVDPNGNANRGFSPIKGESLASPLGVSAPPDLYECFTFGPFDRPDDAYHQARRASFFQPNIWPMRPEGARAAWQAYYRLAERLARDIMAAMALALGLDERFFDDKIDRHITAMRFVHYPAIADAPEEGQTRASPHTDYGSLTILYQDATSLADGGGLEVRMRDGRWRRVAPLEDAFVINLGDLMADWTNDRWVSTEHRVVLPAPERAPQSRRLSIAFFHHPNYDAVITPLPGCARPGDPVRPPVTSGEHLLAKLGAQQTAAYKDAQSHAAG